MTSALLKLKNVLTRGFLRESLTRLTSYLTLVIEVLPAECCLPDEQGPLSGSRDFL